MTGLRQIRFAPDAASVVLGHADGLVRVHSLTDSAEVSELEGLTSEITVLTPGPSADVWAAGSHGSGAAVWVSKDSSPLHRLAHAERITHLGFDPSGTFLTVDAARHAHLWQREETAEGEEFYRAEVLEILGSTRRVDAGAVDAESGQWYLQVDFDWVVFDPSTRQVVETFDGIDDMAFRYPDGVTRFSHDGRRLAFYWDELTVFDTSNGEKLLELPRRHNPWSLHPADDAETFVLGTADGRLVVLDSAGQAKVDLPVSRSGIVDVDATRDGKLVSFVDASGRGGVVNAASGDLLLGTTGLV